MRDANNTLSHQLYDCLHLWIELLVSWWKGQDQKEMDHDSSQWSQLQSQCFSTSTSINTSFFLRASFTSLIICFAIGASFRLLLSRSDARNTNSDSNSNSNSQHQHQQFPQHRVRRLMSRVWIYISRRSALMLHALLKWFLGDNVVNIPLLVKQTHKREHYVVASSKPNDPNSNPGSCSATNESASASESGGWGGGHIQILQRTRSRYRITETYGLHWPFCMLWDRMIRKSNIKVNTNANANANDDANFGESCGGRGRDRDCLVGGTAFIPRYPNVLNDTSVSAAAAAAAAAA
eukprot:1153146_1